jgi:hypothetical protein
MTLSGRIRHHLQSHVVGYLALFVALSGTALALPGQKQVKSDDIAKGAVKGKAIAADAVSKSKLRSGSVDAAKIVDGSITAAEIAAGAVTATQLANDSVIREKIGQGEINGGKLANGAVNSAKVADGTLLAEDFAAGQISDGFAAVPNPVTFAGDGIAANPGVAYSAPRSGRLLVTATMAADATCVLPCDLEVAIFIDGVEVPGSARAVGDGVSNLTSTGIVPVAAGNHTIVVRRAEVTGDTVALSGEAFSGVLLQ